MSARDEKPAPALERTGRDPMLDPAWSYVDATNLDDFAAADWETLNAQRERYRARTLAGHVLRVLEGQRDDPTFGYQVNNYHHSLQCATLMHRDGLPEEDVVLGLLHDIGFTLCPERHEAFAHCLLAPYLSERNAWILLRHPEFQAFHIHGYPGLDENAREAYRGHRWFEDCAAFVARYDILSIDPRIEVAPLEFFRPMVERFFARRHGEDGGE